MGGKMSTATSGKTNHKYSQILKDEISGVLFKKYDKNADSILSKEEVRKMLSEEFGLDDNQIKIAASLMDEDLSGTVDMKEFYEILKEENMCRVICDTESCRFLSEAWKIFRKHDKDHSGNLTKIELKALLKSLDIPAASADKILDEADSSKNALINFNEFVHWLPATAIMLKQHKQ